MSKTDETINKKRRSGRPKDERSKFILRTTITLTEGVDDDLIEIFQGFEGKIPQLIISLMRSGADDFQPIIGDDYDPEAALLAAMDDFF
ncbi:MAG: hypothetical protein AAGD96_12280 [Chloroflexota bacterium]